MKKQVVIDYRTDKQAVSALTELGYETIPTLPVPALYDEVKGHADMQLHIVNGKAVCAPEVYEYYKEKLDIEVTCGSLPIGEKYPCDIAYNTCTVGRFAVCKMANTAPEIISEHIDAGHEIIDAKQGYAKCSICVVNETSAITADEGMYNLLKKRGLNVLKIDPCDIELYGMNGFIGGASGLLEDDLLAFNGDIRTHRNRDSITGFCKNAGVKIVCLNTGKLADIGTIIRIP